MRIICACKCRNEIVIFCRLAFQLMKQSIADEKPAIDRLGKTGSALVKLVGAEESEKLHELLEDVTSRFDFIKNAVRERSNCLDEALLQTSQVISSKLFSGSTCYCNISGVLSILVLIFAV